MGEAFRPGRSALVAYLTAGHPTRALSLEAIRTAARYADLLELGLPFSDPVADGPVIQRSSAMALKGGMTVGEALRLLREAAVEIPVVVFGYLNPVLQYGPERFATDARQTGVAAALIVDLPALADPVVEDALASGGLDLIRLLAPTTDDRRLRAITSAAAGFLYLVSRLGVTGMSSGPDTAGLATMAARIRAASALPLVAGFGVRGGADAARLAHLFDGVAVGSALVDRLETDGVVGLGALLQELRTALDQRRVA